MPLTTAEQQPELLLNMYINNRSSDNRMQRPARELRGWARSQGERGQSNPAAPGVHYALERHGKLAIGVNNKHGNLERLRRSKAEGMPRADRSARG